MDIPFEQLSEEEALAADETADAEEVQNNNSAADAELSPALTEEDSDENTTGTPKLN
ncbi:hypothetical protein RQN30_00770 [Arcanobacterium hippocoleae]